MFSKVKEWDNRRETKSLRLPTKNSRMWTRRVQWLEDNETGTVKLKFDEEVGYREVIIPVAFAQTVYDRFRSGQSADESVSILGSPVPKGMESYKGSNRRSP